MIETGSAGDHHSMGRCLQMEQDLLETGPDRQMEHNHKEMEPGLRTVQIRIMEHSSQMRHDHQGIIDRP